MRSGPTSALVTLERLSGKQSCRGGRVYPICPFPQVLLQALLVPRVARNSVTVSTTAGVGSV